MQYPPLRLSIIVNTAFENIGNELQFNIGQAAAFTRYCTENTPHRNRQSHFKEVF